MAATTLQAQQLATGLPIETGDAVVSSVRFLNSSVSSRIDAPTTAYYLAQPITAWTNCLGPDNNTATAAGVVDLEAQATATVGPTLSTPSVFADVTQGTVNMCTSVAMCQAYTLKYVLQHTAKDFAAPGTSIPQLSAVYAYYYQRVEECTEFGVCACPQCAVNPSCTDKCNPPCVDCGSYLRSAVSVFQDGVCLSAAWPYSSPRDTTPSTDARLNALSFKVTQARCLVVGDGAGLVATMQQELARGNPVVVFLNLQPQQATWMQAQAVGVPGVPDAAGVSPLVMPEASASVSGATAVGHVVLVDGYDSAAHVFLVRNNFGLRWGVSGRFAMRYTSMTPTQVHSAVSVQGVCGPPPAAITTSLKYNDATTCSTPSLLPSQ